MRRRPRAPAPPSPTPGAAPQYRHRLPRLPSPPPESRRRRPRVEPPSVSPGAVPESRCRPCEEPPGRRRVLPLRAEEQVYYHLCQLIYVNLLLFRTWDFMGHFLLLKKQIM
ncbi:sulfated surface glycoprotein 185-like isoform X2 [Panicum virgatum]|uniref:sulfated surface glycoprotein 185-like isoform X2 n=1 Tax=Panicum virgatum TaxID=38727 RepID=UPI0019D5562F|nr:sulfated surface glycoprotein 185-like isoform X2 [Panicum virgatum]